MPQDKEPGTGNSVLWAYVPSKVLTVAGGAVLAVYGVPVILGAVGFMNTGIYGGAAAIQSVIGNVARGGAFAILQSTGVAGLGPAGKTIFGVTGGIVSVKVFRILSTYYKSKLPKKQ